MASVGVAATLRYTHVLPRNKAIYVTVVAIFRHCVVFLGVLGLRKFLNV